jgi:hypothetical protein
LSYRSNEMCRELLFGVWCHCIAIRENGSHLFDLMFLSVWFRCSVRWYCSKKLENFLTLLKDFSVVVLKACDTLCPNLQLCNGTRVMKPTWYIFIFSLFSHYTSTCCGLAGSLSSGGSNVYMWQLLPVPFHPGLSTVD